MISLLGVLFCQRFVFLNQQKYPSHQRNDFVIKTRIGTCMTSITSLLNKTSKVSWSQSKRIPFTFENDPILPLYAKVFVLNVTKTKFRHFQSFLIGLLVCISHHQNLLRLIILHNDRNERLLLKIWFHIISFLIILAGIRFFMSSSLTSSTVTSP